ncbi:hypothetical protein [Virgibacillus byunsanensis]|uniref:hypothetical protein n=1 Tax=Virgibacillus byunsanensis TaxID=570945 RepID=UPI0036F3AC63
MLHSLLPEKMIGLHHWAQWKKVTTLLKDIRTSTYYQSELFDENQFRESGLLFRGALTDYETKGMDKLKSRKTTA